MASVSDGTTGPGAANEPAAGPLFQYPMVRTIVTLLIIFHCYLVGTAVASNFAPSGWQQQLLSRFRFYTRLFNFDLNFTPYHLTHATEADVDHRVEVLPKGETEWVSLPPPLFRGLDSYKRYQRLGYVWAYEAENGGDPAHYAQAIGTHFARQRSLPPQQLRCRRHFLQSQEDLLTGTPARRDPFDASFFSVVYAANAIVSNTGYVEVVRVDDTSQVAQPVRKPGAKP